MNGNNLISLIQNNNNNLNPKNFWINFGQLNLINSIIDFYHKNGRIFMNFNEKFQIMNLINNINPDYAKIQNENNILDPLHYIKEEKIVITFINHDFKITKVKIPKFINKSDLYSIAKLYKSNYRSKLLLIHNESILENNESSIDNICNNDIIIIIEDKYYLDTNYYQSYGLMMKERKIPVFIEGGDIYCTLCFPDDISFSEMLKVIFFQFGLDQSSLVNKNIIEYAKRNMILRDKFNYFNNAIHFSNNVLAGSGSSIGKAIKGEIFDFGKNRLLIVNIGLLNSNKNLIDRIYNFLGLHNKHIKKIIINGKEIDIKEEKSLLSLGIKYDFICFIEL